MVGVFDVKKRAYFGNTSMEAEISLLMANQTLASISDMKERRKAYAQRGSPLLENGYMIHSWALGVWHM